MAYLIICFFFGLAGGMVGRAKGSSCLLGFTISALLPLLGLLAPLFYRVESDEVRQCPRCGRIVKLYDQVCMRCGEDLDFPETAIAPESMAAGHR